MIEMTFPKIKPTEYGSFLHEVSGRHSTEKPDPNVRIVGFTLFDIFMCLHIISTT